ncbi:hypothetical protein [Pseudomonas sp. UFMG81]|jgi:uncharacterized delta-60 repeat protein|uniref:hypothetical protein n=1 Tax=Pseudomonas sp. UFMG81 TaxID=2745936 RepID=UPI00188F9F4C|nr:hypothetical protein [Pseudomonas sp. UFMG81]
MHNSNTADSPLDPNFGEGGIAWVSEKISRITACLPVKDRLLCAGIGREGHYVLFWLNNHGTLDPVFPEDGIVKGVFPGDLGVFHPTGITLLADKRLLLSGPLQSNNNIYHGLVCLHKNGALDTTFGNAGYWIFTPPADRPDKALTLPSTTYNDSSHTFNDQHGKSDHSAFLEPHHGSALGPCIVQGTDALYVIARHNEGRYLCKLDLEGKIDTGFAEQGYRQFTEPGELIPQMLLLQDDRILLVGYRRYDFYGAIIIRLKTNGERDEEFGDYGEVKIANEWFLSAALKEDGSIVCIGDNALMYGKRAVIRLFTADGHQLELETNYKDFYRTDSSNSSWQFISTAQPKQVFMLFGSGQKEPITGPYGLVLGRYHASGLIDDSFFDAGTFHVRPLYNVHLHGYVMQPDGATVGFGDDYATGKGFVLRFYSHTPSVKQ